MRSPVIQTSEFSAMIASAVFGGTAASSSAAQVVVGDERDASGQLHLRVRREMLGDVRIVRDAAEEGRGQGRDEIAPAKAVPIEAPRFVTVF